MTTRARAETHSAGGPQSRARAGDRPPARTRFTGGLLILLSLLSAAACCWAFGRWLPADSDRYRDYRAAEPCSSREREQGRTDCLSTWHLTVEKTVNKTAGKSTSYEATLTDRDTWRTTVSFGDPGPLLRRLEPGDRVRATVWRRDIVALTKGDVRQDTAAAPRDEVQMNAAIGTLAGLTAAQTFVLGAARLTRPRTHGPLTWNPYGKWLLVTTPAICFGVGLPAVWTGIPWWIVPTVAAPAVACATALTHRRSSRSADRDGD
ncbi:hypothetical protein AB0H82_13285 [Streptomyces sp. NPDC050732]|uniref:hypothetical protein n=1 Tax=Streptomyces sp. NPDC050732 TaxID=3154632 RepID=UPI003416258E